ncbi:hypothetical protein K5F27_16985 [Acinetobacter baumannii]|uniref:hypothetical protein n=1 Tax=Acinetobacter baumannii TaxID=470 RepID=UPI001FF153C6|nr:hypothetical protein [Acinetobacter baumannii]MCJ9118960.1 hypothetical protein [Acinetobacter baumannii]MCJ9181395.1 hypothetical protein [Acinetobacter baumannii]MCJ9185114.1 hypothetical protein [Acinetobacter baumannii]MCJ9192353.1 hypothetical protein [Acinetobacter baumannii]MCJ9199708.1 hypothetical protein [Acinetobacter baumannii]
MDLQLRFYKQAQGELDNLRQIIKEGRPQDISNEHWKLIRKQRVQLEAYTKTLKQRMKLIENGWG